MNTIQSLYEKFITKSGARLESYAPNVFAFSSENVFVVANSYKVMRELFEVEKSSVFKEYRETPKTAKSETFQFFDNTDEGHTFFAKKEVGKEFKVAMQVIEDTVLDFDSDFSMGGARFIIFASSEEKIKPFLTKIRDMHIIECEIPTDEKKSSVVPGLKVNLCSSNGEIGLKNDGMFVTKRDLDNMPMIVENALEKKHSKEREI